MAQGIGIRALGVDGHERSAPAINVGAMVSPDRDNRLTNDMTILLFPDKRCKKNFRSCCRDHTALLIPFSLPSLPCP
jgi:hypothetical protein